MQIMQYVGTAIYMAPECFVLTEDLVTESVDIWAWVLIGNALVSLEEPWEDMQIKDV